MKDLLVLSLSLMNDDTKAQYMRMIQSVPLYINSSLELQRLLAAHSPCLSPPPNSSVALCAIQSSSGPFLQQWLAHYIALGVEKVYLMNHADDYADYTNAALKPFIDAGFVQLYTYPTPSEAFPQLQIYQHCHLLARAGNHSWLGVIDVDEYWIATKLYNFSITPNEPSIGNDSVHCLPHYLSHYSHRGGLVFPWRFLSSVGAPVHNFGKLILEQYDYENDHNPTHIKSFYNLKYLNKVGHVHYSTNYTQNKTSVNIEGRVEPDFHVRNISHPRYLGYAEFRHYWGMSLQDNIYFKICGSSWERRFGRGPRTGILLRMLKEAGRAKVAAPVPTGYLRLLKKILKVP